MPGNKPNSPAAPTVEAVRAFLEDACASVPVISVPEPTLPAATVLVTDPLATVPFATTAAALPKAGALGIARSGASLAQIESRLGLNSKKLSEGERELGFVDEEMNEGWSLV